MKLCIFPELNLLKENHFQRGKNENFNFCLNLLPKTSKSPFNFYPRKKVNKTEPPMKFENIRGGWSKKKLKFWKLKAPEPSSCFLAIKLNFFSNTGKHFFSGQKFENLPRYLSLYLFLFAKTKHTFCENCRRAVHVYSLLT